MYAVPRFRSASLKKTSSMTKDPGTRQTIFIECSSLLQAIPIEDHARATSDKSGFSPWQISNH